MRCLGVVFVDVNHSPSLTSTIGYCGFLRVELSIYILHGPSSHHIGGWPSRCVVIYTYMVLQFFTDARLGLADRRHQLQYRFPPDHTPMQLLPGEKRRARRFSAALVFPWKFHGAFPGPRMTDTIRVGSVPGPRLSRFRDTEKHSSTGSGLPGLKIFGGLVTWDFGDVG